MAGIFISYRRTSAPLVTQIYERIRAAFPDVEIFLDWPSIKPGAKFPDAIEQALSSSEILLVMIDPKWTSVQDESSDMRRLDMPDDWVRKEVERSLNENKLVIPVLIAGARMPKEKKLPGPLQGLAEANSISIHDEYFAEDVNKLITHIRSKIVDLKLRDYDTPSNPYPTPREFRPRAIHGAERKKMLADLPRWKVVRSAIQEKLTDGPTTRVEIKREFRFPSFRDAIRFMNKASKRIDPYDHHPRWENVYDRVTVGLSTWDSGHIITDRDYKTALMLEGLYREFLEGG